MPLNAAFPLAELKAEIKRRPGVSLELMERFIAPPGPGTAMPEIVAFLRSRSEVHHA